MARQRAGDSQSTISDLFESTGAHLLHIGQHEYMIRQDDGTFRMLRRGESIILDDGTQWNAGMLVAANGRKPVLLALCDVCRNPPCWLLRRPRLGLVRRDGVKVCVSCHAVACRLHHVRCADRKIRCTRCAALFTSRRMLVNLFRPLFFTRK